MWPPWTPWPAYVTEVPYQGQRLGLMAPGMLREVGDVAHLAALCALRRVVLAGGVWGSGKALTVDERQATFAFPTEIGRLLKAPEAFRLLASDDAAAVVKAHKVVTGADLAKRFPYLHCAAAGHCLVAAEK